jgi:CRP-like cAMP-binding protein
MPIRLLSSQNAVKPRTVLQSNLLVWLPKSGIGSRIAEYSKTQVIFSQAATADAVFYILEGTVILRVVSSCGKEAIVGILGPGEFFGEGCLAGEPLRTSTAVALTDCSAVRLEKISASRLIRDVPAVSELFLHHLLSRNMKMEEDLVDQLFNTSEKRLARLLVQLANFDDDSKPEAVIPKMSQETLAEIVGTTRSRVSLFMNKFRRLGLIDYIDHADVLTIRSSLLNVVLHEGTAPSRNKVGVRAGAIGERPGVKTDDYCSFGQMSV